MIARIRRFFHCLFHWHRAMTIVRPHGGPNIILCNCGKVFSKVTPIEAEWVDCCMDMLKIFKGMNK